MNLVGKIMVMLIFVMSLVFMSLSAAVFATHRNWRQLVENTEPASGPIGYKMQLEQKEEQLKQEQDARKRIELELNAERDAKYQVMAKLEQKAASLQKELADLQAQHTKVQDDLSGAVAALAIAQDNVKAAEDQRTDLQGELKEITEEKDRYFAQLTETISLLNEARGKWNRLQDSNAKIAEQISQMEQVFENLGVNWVAISAGQDPPQLSGRVTESRDSKFVQISLGSDDGLRSGHELEVSRGGKYMGRIRVIKTAPDAAVGEVLRDYLEAPIQENDRVRTKAKAKSSGVVVQKAKSDAFTAMLAISLVAIITACIILYFEMKAYDFDIEANSVRGISAVEQSGDSLLAWHIPGLGSHEASSVS